MGFPTGAKLSLFKVLPCPDFLSWRQGPRLQALSGGPFPKGGSDSLGTCESLRVVNTFLEVGGFL
jgi:hypothetical protein